MDDPCPTNRMVEAGAWVMICDKMIPSDRTSLPPNIEFIECDVRDKESFLNAFLTTKDNNVNNAGVLKEAQYEGKCLQFGARNFGLEV